MALFVSSHPYELGPASPVEFALAVSPASASTRWRLAWFAALGLCTALETYALRRREKKATLSELTRWCFHTQSRTGKTTFTLGWCAFALWYLAHINRGPGPDRVGTRLT